MEIKLIVSNKGNKCSMLKNKRFFSQISTKTKRLINLTTTRESGNI